MKLVEVALDHEPYPIYIGSGTLKNRSLWERHLAPGPVLVITNDTVAPLYLDALKQGLEGTNLHTVIIPDGEAHKTAVSWKRLLNQLADMGATRDSTVVALGGGVVGDLAGFTAATYMRGIRFIQAPTTLLAQVDAAIGGKTGINLRQGKNLAGAFHQPQAVISDIDTMNTLPAREYAAGLAEVLKYGIIRDASYFHWLVANSDIIKARLSDVLTDMIFRASAHKAEVVAADEKESGERALLNYGHTFGHALETAGQYQKLLHGEAVSIGMVLAARLSERIGLCNPGAANAIQEVLSHWELPTSIPTGHDAKHLFKLMQLDKKAQHDGLRLILIKELGKACIYKETADSDLLDVLKDH